MRALWTAPVDLALVASEAELRTLQEQVRAVAEGETSEIVVSLEDEGDPGSYSRLLSVLRIQVDEGPTQVTVQNGIEMQVFGAPENLKKFSSFLNLDPGVHTHFEHYDGNPHIRLSSVPLVIECEP